MSEFPYDMGSALPCLCVLQHLAAVIISAQLVAQEDENPAAKATEKAEDEAVAEGIAMPEM